MRKKSAKWLRLLIPFIAVLGFNGLVFAGDVELSDPPESTMRTLEEQTPALNKNLPDSERLVDALDGNTALDMVSSCFGLTPSDPGCEDADVAPLGGDGIINILDVSFIASHDVGSQ
ncbi:MAG: hypothetical protein ACUZ8O_01310 [Candidatus Anammoxibacter sp.]